MTVWLAAAAVTILLLLVAGRYGFHGDELYFVVTGRHPQVGAPDNPMLVPYLAAGWYALVGGHLWAFRILPALAAGAYVLLGAGVARAFNASTRQQAAAAIAVAMTALVLAVGHLFETTTFDMLLTAAAIGMLVVALRAEPQRWPPWIGVGLLAGTAMEVKILAAPVLACCLLGVLIVGPRSRLASARPWVAVALALVLAGPNLSWQATHGFPMLRVASNISGGGSASSTARPLLLPITLLDIGPVVSIVFVVGLVVLLRRPRRGIDGWLAVGFLIFFGLLLVTGGKAYYPAAFFPAVLAAGAGPTLNWIRAGPRRWRRRGAAALAVVSLVVTPSLTLPVWPAGSVPYGIAVGPNPDLADEIGWPGYVDTVGQVVAAVPADERARTIVLTDRYQLAAALELLDPANGVTLPPVFSGRNAFWYWGPPPESATAAVVVGNFPAAQLDRTYARCSVVTTIGTPAGVHNELTGTPVRRCDGRREPWSVLWPELLRTR